MSISRDSSLVFPENKGNHDKYDVFGQAPCTPPYAPRLPSYAPDSPNHQWFTLGQGQQSSQLQSYACEDDWSGDDWSGDGWSGDLSGDLSGDGNDGNFF